MWNLLHFTYAQIQQTEIYSPLYPPVSESLIPYAGAAIIPLLDERLHEMNRVLNHGYEIKRRYDPHNFSNYVDKPVKFRAYAVFKM